MELAERIVEAVPSIDRVRLVNSGTEAAMSAIRLARGATGRDLIVKFEGCYHGHSDPLLAKGAGSGLATLGIPSSPGVTEGAARDTLSAPFNDLEAVRTILAERGDDVAVVAVEPVAANMGVVPPEPGFLEGLRALCDEHGVLLLFDEVITGFRIAYRGAQSFYGVTPDLTVLGKVMGGGFPCAAFGGRADLMAHLAPDGPVYQAGTLSGNPGRSLRASPRSTWHASRSLPEAGSDRRRPHRRHRGVARRRPASPRRSTGRAPCSASSSPTGPCATSTARAAPTTAATDGSSTTCWPRRVAAAVRLRTVDA